MFLAPEEVAFLTERFGSPLNGLRALLKEALEGSPPEATAEEGLKRIGFPRTAEALKGKVPKAKLPTADDMCERCRRLGVPSCEACRKIMGQA